MRIPTKSFFLGMIFSTLGYGMVSAQCTLDITDVQETTAVSCNASSDGEATVIFTGAVGTASFQWLDETGQDLGINSDVATGLSAGSYTVIITDADNCTADTSINISEPTPVTYTVTRTNTPCGATSGELDVTGVNGCGGNFMYSIDGGPMQSSGTFSNLGVGFYTITVQDSCGCTSSSTEFVNTTNGPLLVNLNFIEPLCNGSDNGSITMFAFGANPLQYSIDSGATFASTNVFTNLAPNNYHVIIEDATGCQTIGFIQMTEPELIAPDPVFINESCVGNNGSITLNQTGGVTPFQYSIDNGATFQSSNSFTGLTGGTYDYIYLDDNACSATGQITLTTGAGPTIIDSTILQPTCDVNCNGFIMLEVLGNGPMSYSLNGGTPQADSVFSGLCDGTYTVSIEDADGCTTSQTITLTAPVSPTAGFSADVTSGISPLTVNFTNSSINANTYSWNFGDGSAIDTSTNPQHIFSGTGVYSVMLVAEATPCSDTAYLTIDVTGEPGLTAPNVFTPNFDGVNDVFRPQAIGMDSVQGEIYNRWGELVFEWWGVNGYWDGYTKPSGQMAPAGTYFYVITATGMDSNSFVETGTVQLMR